MDLQEVLLRLLKAQIEIGSSVILWREIIGNGFGLASALLGMWRKVAAWPVGIVGNVLLFTVFVGTAIGGPFDTPQKLDLWGQAGRQIFFIIVSVYGWVRWYQYPEVARRGGRRRTPEVGRRERSPAAARRRRGSHDDLLLRAEGVGVLGSAGRCLDLDRLDLGDVRHGAGLGRILAGLDRG